MTSKSIWIIVNSAAVLWTGCTTTKRDHKDPAEIAARSERVSGDVVVVKPFTKTPVISDKDHSYWVNLRSNATNELAKMRGQLATGEWQAAAESAKTFLMKNPSHVEATMGLASAYAIGRRYEMAGYYAAQVLRLQAGNSDAMNIMGLRTMMATGNRRADFQDAIVWFQKSIDADGTQIAGALNLGHLQLELGDSSAAATSFSTASQRCGNCERGLMGLGIAAARSGRADDAEFAFERVLSKNPANGEAKYQLAMNYRNNKNDRATATKLLQELVSDQDGRFQNEGAVKRQANIALRRLKASDRSGGDLQYATQNVRPHSKEQEKTVIPTSDSESADEE